MLQSRAFNDAEERYIQFCQSLGANGQLWSSYLDMVDLILQFIRSTREANWEPHVACLLELLPWFHAYGRTNYARYLPVYILHMLQLPTTHPTAHEQLVAGEFAIQWSKGNTYGRILHDQAIKVTNNNKDAKSHGGIISITLRPAAVFKWMVLGADRAEFTGSSM